MTTTTRAGAGLLALLALATAPAAAQDTTSAATARPGVADTGSAATSAAPSTPAGTTETRYTLVSVNGKALPTEVEKELRCREDVAAGTLALRSDGRWRLETTRRETCGDRTEEDLDDDDGTYRTEGRTLRFFDDDGRENTDDWDLRGDIDLDDFRTGTLAADGTLTVELADGKNRLVFRPESR